MGWFDEQIRLRAETDQNAFGDAFLDLAGAVLGRSESRRMRDELLQAREALDEILKYYHSKPTDVPDTVKSPEEQLEYILRPLGLMTRDVHLTDGWYRDAYGPMLGSLKEDGTPVALMPGAFGGYTYTDPATGEKVHVTQKTAGLLSRDALCFYKPLPLKKLGIPDLLRYMKSCITNGDILMIVLATLAVEVVGLAGPKVYSIMTGPVLDSKSVSMLISMFIFLISATLSAKLFSLVRDLLMDRINQKTSVAVEAATMMRLLALPVSFFRKYSSGELSNRVTSVSSLCNILLGSVLSTGLSSLTSLIYIGQIFSFAPALVVPSLLIILATVVLSALSTLLQMNITRRKMQLSAEESGISYALVSGIQKIRLSGAEKRAFSRWAKVYSQSSELEFNPPMFLKINELLTLGVELVGNIVLYYFAVSSAVAPNQYYAFTASYGHVMGAFTALAGIALSVAEIRPSLEMAEPILKTVPEVTADRDVLTQVSGAIEMSHVSFRYEDNTPWVIRDLNLKIRAGEYIAIVGRTGCGKSTLMRLLLGFEIPQEGVIFYDGRDLNTIDPKSLRRRMGVVTQNGQLFQGDLFSNITISAPNLTLKEAWEAAEIAGIADDIREMPMGMQTVITEGQGGISGGQKQRIMIARAVAPKPKILMFDEATSALDNKTQKKVAEALDSLKCTRIVIAHRLSTIRNCDRILVMDQGSIIEEGTYEELIEQHGFFAELVDRQRLDREEDQGTGAEPPAEQARTAGENAPAD